ncbi:hypothetical protein [Sulfurirhabdus autotrophica]|uniref:HNH endonuclease n=1 Tax=Sulfurirhabdus autotrophica TaxID=1706046 RepID=A0A4R3Y451_9PROT|nr:hypothetical protein [Sulfurirhabdus autotrophica]TCV86322.1 hypothetical protein EDC63_1079 [Sulfurirhabdus autotrophica]
MDYIEIPLGNYHEPVIIDVESLLRLRAAGVSENWFVNDDGANNLYVRVKHNGKVASVARLITNAPKGSWVTFVNNNKLDLRLKNLWIIAKKKPSYFKHNELIIK